MFARLSFVLFLLQWAAVEGGSRAFRSRSRKQTAAGGVGVFELPLRSVPSNAHYVGEVSVGTPPKNFLVNVDTGSLELWLPAYNCQGEGYFTERLCANRSLLYNPNESQTGKRTTGNKKRGQRLRESTPVRGHYFEDVFAFGNASRSLQLKKPMVFGAADLLNGLEHGLLGLGLSTRFDQRKPLVEQAVAEGLIARPFFSLFFKQTPPGTHGEDGGMLTLGDEDRKNCGPVLGWAPAFSYGGPWQVRASGLSVGRFVHRREAIAVFDSGSPLIYLPPDVLDGVVRELSAFFRGHDFVVDCRRKFALKITIAGRTYAIGSDALTRPIYDNHCVLYVGRGEDQWVLGVPFQRAVCTVHDFQQRRVGFALAKP
ncbi:Peptidase A1 domain-containing protein [Aphelenchoides fujianensis]|nr:Peptidase A1 domain-containing protein [Aphelenchoides fujianensis]